MIVKAFEKEKIKKSKEILYLLYGSNDGYKKEVINNCFLEGFEGVLKKYDEKDVLDQKEEIISGLLNKSFFNDEKLIIIYRSSDKILKFVETILDKKISEIKILLIADQLDRRSKLRSLFEKERNTVCIPFYKDDLKTLTNISYTFFKSENIPISQEALNIIVERSNGDRIFLRNELLKIKNYFRGEKKINLEVVNILTNLSENFSVSELVDNCLAKNTIKTCKMLNENIFSLEDCILIIRTFLLKSKRILNIRINFDESKNLDNELRNYKPIIFWKDKEIVKNQISSWNKSDIQKLIYKINKIELLIKKNSENSLKILSDFILNTSKKVNN